MQLNQNPSLCFRLGFENEILFPVFERFPADLQIYRRFFSRTPLPRCSPAARASSEAVKSMPPLHSFKLPTWTSLRSPRPGAGAAPRDGCLSLHCFSLKFRMSRATDGPFPAAATTGTLPSGLRRLCLQLLPVTCRRIAGFANCLPWPVLPYPSRSVRTPVTSPDSDVIRSRLRRVQGRLSTL